MSIGLWPSFGFGRNQAVTQARPVLGIGHPRGGTRYVARLLVTSGIRALHESKGSGGCVSCWLSVPDWYNPHSNSCGLRSDYPSDSHLLHVVRHPLSAIPSLKVFHHGSWWHWQEKHTGLEYRKDDLGFYAQFWIRWNEIIDQQKPFARILIEHPEWSWPIIAETLGANPVMPEVPIDPSWLSKSKNKVQITWGDLGKHESNVRQMAAYLGYED